MESAQPIRYSLSRSQRLIPLLRIWGTSYVVFVVLLLAFFLWRFVAMTISLDWRGMLTFGGLSLFVLFWCRGLAVGLVDVVLHRRRAMDITIEQNGLGVLIGDERWYLFLDGITRISSYIRGVWTIEHWNGCVVNIDANAISDEQLNHMRAMMVQGRTPERMAAVVERGRRIKELTDHDRKA